MSSQILLIRHAAHAHLGNILSGRIAGQGLSSDGKGQTRRLASQCARIGIHRLECSPVQRAVETATAIAREHDGLTVEIEPELDELDFGDWSGRSFDDLADDPQWRDWNSSRATSVAPNGESMAQAQTRAWEHIANTAATAPSKTIAMVTHCDIIRAVIARVLDLSLDHILRFDVDPASVSRIAVGPWGAKVLSINETCP